MESIKDPDKKVKPKGFLNKFISVLQPSKKQNYIEKKIELPIEQEKRQAASIILPVQPNLIKETKPNNLFDDQLQADFDTIDNISRYLKETENNKETFLDHEELFEMAQIDILPVELLCKILDYLDFSDRKNASLVCRKWRHAFLESYYLKNIMIKANNHLFVSNRPNSSSKNSLGPPHRASSAMALSTYSSNSNFNFQLYNNLVNLEFEKDSADVSLMLENLQTRKTKDQICALPKLKSLKFTKTTMSARTLIDLLKEVSSLENLSIIECDSLFMTGFLSYSLSKNQIEGLQRLSELSLSKNRYLTDNLINLFLNSTNHLKSIDLSYCNFTKTNFKSIENSNFKTQNMSNCVLTFENLIKQAKFLENLQSLNLSGVENIIHNQESFFDLVSNLPNLCEIYLANLPNLKVETVLRIFDLAPKLKLIDLNNSIQNNDLKQISIEHCLEKSRSFNTGLHSRLEVLKLNRAKINDPKLLVMQFSSIDKLTYLDLSCMMFQTSFGSVDRLNQFIEEFALNISKCSKLEYLILSYCDFVVNDNFMKIISKNLNLLRHLNIRNCTQITDKSLHFICTFMKKLVHVDLSWCQNISDFGLNRSIQYGPDKQLLNEFNKHMNGSCRCIRKYTEQPFLLIKTKNELNAETKKNFCGCVEKSYETTFIDDSNVEIADDDEIIQDVSFKYLKMLKVLKLEACVNVSDLGIQSGVNWKNLNELDIKLCTNVTGDFVKEEIEIEDKRLFSNLKILNLNQCLKFQEENLLYLVENSPNLRELSLGGLSGITNKLIEILLKMKKLLILLDISFCTDINESWVEKYEQFLFNEFGLRDFFIDKRFISK